MLKRATAATSLDGFRMFVDAHEVPEGTILDTDVCIIGAGAAGITLAREFIDAPFRASVLESGGLEYDDATQQLYRGRNVGRKYYELDACRLRYFGGTTNHWAGWCRPLNAIDFEEHSWMPYSGWPFGLEDILPYYYRAQHVCQLGEYGYDNIYLQDHAGVELLPLNEGQMVTEVIQFALAGFGQVSRFGQVYRPIIKAAANVAIYLNANVTNIETGETQNEITRLRVATLNGRKFWITAKYYILAAGGIENARLLLVSNETRTAGLGNENDLVGRFFMDHPAAEVGLFLPVNPGDKRWATYCEGYLGRFTYTDPLGVLAPRRSILEQDQILHCYMGLKYVFPDSKGWIALGELVHGNNHSGSQIVSDLWRILSNIEGVVGDGYEKLKYGSIAPKVFNIYCYGQTAPDPDSRVTLDQERDALGLPRIKLDLHLSELARHSIMRTLEIFAGRLGESGLGRVKIAFDDWPVGITYGSHHMGTTRMSANPKYGVVNADCRTHGIGNLYVAGSSVFPTSGSANPTLTIVALALRLADQIKRCMRG
jgi:choline dehydrogenase-like flavoprotein